MLDKVGIGILVVGAAGIGGVVIVKPSWLTPNKSKNVEINWKPLSQDTGFSATSGDYQDKFGSIYGNYFLGLDNSNSDLWTKAFEQLKEDSLSSNPSQHPGEKFKYVDDENKSPITKATSSKASEKGLNQICNEVYKSATSGIAPNGTYKESDVWKYCSPLGSKPTTITTSEYSTPSVGSGPGARVPAPDTTAITKLISTIGNDLFWEIRNKEFKGIDGYGKIEQQKDDFFDPNKTESVRNLCKVAYKKDFQTTDASITPKVFKYCSLEKRQ